MSKKPKQSPSPGRKKAFIVFVLLILAVAAGIVVENKRGNTNWESCKSEIVAKGEELDWSAYNPKSVPDSENMLAIPIVDAWFNRLTTREDLRTNLIKFPGDWKKWGCSTPATIEELKKLPVPAKRQGEPSLTNLLVWFRQYDKPLKQISDGMKLPFARPMTHTAKTAEQVKPSAKESSEADSENLNRRPAENKSKPAPVASKTATLPEPEWEPNGDAGRILAQTLATRAKALLLLGNPDAALHDLTFIRRMTDIYSNATPSLSLTMLRLTLMGIYAHTLYEGLSENLWKESHLITIQQQLSEFTFPSDFMLAVRSDRAELVALLETERGKAILNYIHEPDMLIRLYCQFSPRGWFERSLTTLAPIYQKVVETFDPKKGVFDLSKIKTVSLESDQLVSRQFPYKVLPQLLIKDFHKGAVRTAQYQNTLHAALLACALERYRLQKNAYPAGLEALAPEFIARVPMDVLTGENYKYRRTDSGSYVLWSVGANGKDDGGSLPEKPKSIPGDSSEPDWTWLGPEAKK